MRRTRKMKLGELAVVDSKEWHEAAYRALMKTISKFRIYHTMMFLFFLAAYPLSLFCQTGFWANTNDHLMWNDQIYMCNKSPISSFKGYNHFNLYPNVTKMIGEFGEMTQDKEYKICWGIVDSMLYLCDIHYIFYQDDTYEDKKRHLPIEKLTGQKFSPPNFEVPEYLKEKINPRGVILAKWFSGKLYIKPLEYLNKSYENLKTHEEIDLYYYCIRFKEGKIHDIEKKIIEDGIIHFF